MNRRFGGKDGEQAQADFINVTAWRATAEFITRYFRKGSSICIFGSIQTRSWTDQNGQKRFATEIVADEAYFVDMKSENPIAPQSTPVYSSPAAVPGQPYIPESYAQLPVPQFENISDDDELPF